MPKFQSLLKNHKSLSALLLAVFVLSIFLLRQPGVKVDIPELSDQSDEQADTLIIESLDETLTVTYAGASFETTPRAMGFGYDKKSTDYELNQSFLAAVLARHFPELAPPSDAGINVDGYRRAAVIPHKDGMQIDFAKLQQDLKTIVLSGSPQPLVVSASPAPATYTATTADQDLAAIKEMLNQKMNFFYTTSVEKTDNFPMKFEPAWVTVKNGQYVFNEPDIKAYIKDTIAASLDRERADAVIKALPEEGSLYATVEGRAFDGWEVDQEKTYNNFKEKISQKIYDIPIEIKITEGKVINETGVDLGDLQQLSQGKSGYWGSGLGRKANIEKGLNEKLAHILLAPGQEFHFNDFIGDVTGAQGWKPALAIFGGDELISVPGGGLCQVSTTFYRAIVRAGLEVIEKSNHTLYITYYEEYGNGLDAAVYPGSKDFKFKNNTDHYLFIESYTDREIGYVDVYGTPIHKSVEMLGPFYHSKVPEKFQAQVNPNWNEIAWIQRITALDGTVTDNIVMGKYKTGPRKLYPYVD